MTHQPADPKAAVVASANETSGQHQTDGQADDGLHEAATVQFDGSVEPSSTVRRLGREALGSYLGPYKLLKLMGEGGMGAVYLAEQEKPVRRRVALKIIKPGMDSAQVITRFEAERQALAMMDHQSIARVFDAGTTDS